MDWTLGAIMFYGGIAGAALVAVASVAAAIVLKISKKKIVKRLNEEYGGNIK